MIGFLQAANKADYELASNYLEGKQSAKRKAELARNLHVVLNRGLKIGPDDLSKAPAGSLADGLPANLEKVGTATFGSESLDIVLRLTKTPDTPPIWLFSAETLLGVTAAASQLDLPWAEAIWPESFRDIRFLSYPLFTWLNVLLSIPLLVGIAWPLTRGLLRLLHPLDLRHSTIAGESVLAQIKWLLFLLIFSLLARRRRHASCHSGGAHFRHLCCQRVHHRGCRLVIGSVDENCGSIEDSSPATDWVAGQDRDSRTIHLAACVCLVHCRLIPDPAQYGLRAYGRHCRTRHWRNRVCVRRPEDDREPLRHGNGRC